MEFQRELAAKEGELTKAILERMQRIMRRIGQAEGYTLILERNEAGVVFVPSTYDLTDVLIQRYNAGEGKEGAAPDEARPSLRREACDREAEVAVAARAAAKSEDPGAVNLDITKILTHPAPSHRPSC